MDVTLRMSMKERRRLEVFSRVKCGELSVGKAAVLLGVSLRQARRMWRRYCQEGDGGLVHRLRGRPGNAAKASSLREAVLERCRERYADFGSVLAAEYLQRDGHEVSPKTLWRWRRASGALLPTRRGLKHRTRRERRPCLGELLQMDGSTHDWFEGRRGPCVLFVTTDDATNRLFCRFYESEDTASAFDLFGRYVRKYGLPTALYVDKDSIYRVNNPQAREAGQDRGKMPQTQFGRAMEQLDVTVICADSPQAKGRVERMNGTLQDRLVKALRLENLSTIEAANAYLQRTFLPAHNRRFMKQAATPTDVHRKIPEGLVLSDVLCVRETRVVSRDWCVSYEGQILQIDKRHEGLSLAGRVVTVQTMPDGKRHVTYKGQKLRWQPAAATSAPARPAADHVPARPAAADRAASAAREPWRPPADHPWRRPRQGGSAPGRLATLAVPSAPPP